MIAQDLSFIFNLSVCLVAWYGIGGHQGDDSKAVVVVGRKVSGPACECVGMYESFFDRLFRICGIQTPDR